MNYCILKKIFLWRNGLHYLVFFNFVTKIVRNKYTKVFFNVKKLCNCHHLFKKVTILLVAKAIIMGGNNFKNWSLLIMVLIKIVALVIAFDFIRKIISCSDNLHLFCCGVVTFNYF